MGFLDNVIEKANTKNKAKAEAEITPLLLPGETIEGVFLMNEDYLACTNKRVFLVDNKLVSSKKALASFSYGKITGLHLVKGGAFTLSKEVEILVGSLKYEFKSYDENDARAVFNKLSEKTL